LARLNTRSNRSLAPGGLRTDSAVDTSTLRSSLGASPLPPKGSPSCLGICGMVSLRDRGISPLHRLALHRGSPRLLRPLLTPRSALTERPPFKGEARSPRVRTMTFVARPPDLHRFPLATRASRYVARSPWSAVPPIRFLSIGP